MEHELPKCTRSSTESVLPNVANDLSDIVLPSWKKSIIERDVCSLAPPLTDTPLPMAMKASRLQEEPKAMKSSTLTFPAKRANLRTLHADPKLMQPKMEADVPPTRRPPTRDRPELRRVNDRHDRLDAMLMKLIIEMALPHRMKLLIDTELPKQAN
jgi:hypothetical protein